MPAPEPTHALAATIREALACKESGEEKVIVTALCGHGLLDLAAYDAYPERTAWSTPACPMTSWPPRWPPSRSWPGECR